MLYQFWLLRDPFGLNLVPKNYLLVLKLQSCYLKRPSHQAFVEKFHCFKLFFKNPLAEITEEENSEVCAYFDQWIFFSVRSYCSYYFTVER